MGVFALFSSLGATFTIPDDYPLIQTAIDSSASGDTILVRAGTYTENLETKEKILTLKALGSPEETILDGNRQGSVIRVTADAHIEGFTIRNGLDEYGGGIWVERPTGSREILTVTIVKNTIIDNQAGLRYDTGLGGGVYLLYTRDSLIEANTFTRNYAGLSGGGLYDYMGDYNAARNNLFLENGSYACGGAIRDVYEIRGNLILRNWSENGGGGICGGIDVRNNTVVGNYINNATIAQGAGIAIGDVISATSRAISWPAIMGRQIGERE